MPSEDVANMTLASAHAEGRAAHPRCTRLVLLPSTDTASVGSELVRKKAGGGADVERQVDVAT
ncbi:MAG: hypothetical protein LAO31_16715 [Acidobacteriia bacterium]|nr:hypothetical protein [Terriglobia bacterium]